MRDSSHNQNIYAVN